MGQPVPQLTAREVYPHDHGMNIAKNSSADRALLTLLNPTISEVNKFNPEYLALPDTFMDFQKACKDHFQLPNPTVDPETLGSVKSMSDGLLRKVKYFLHSFIIAHEGSSFITDFKKDYIAQMGREEIKDNHKFIQDLDSNPEFLEYFIASLRLKFPTPFHIHKTLISFLYKASLINSESPKKIREYKDGIQNFLLLVYGDRYRQYIQYLGLRYRKLIPKNSDLEFEKGDIQKYPFNIVDPAYREIFEIERSQMDIII